MRIILIFTFTCIFFAVKAQQGFFVNDTSALFTIKKNGLLYVDGDFQYLKSSTAFQAINGEIQLTKDFIFTQEMNFERALTNFSGAKLRFVGNSDSKIIHLNENNIIDSAILYLNQLIVNKYNGDLYIENNINVRDTIFIEKGNVYLDSISRVFLDLSLGTNSVKNNPYILGETAQKRFFGKGFIYANYLQSDSLSGDQFNTGLYLNVPQSSRIEFYRGHTQQLYAGKGSIDRFFDISVTSITNTTVAPDSVFIKYLPDVDYLSMGVDTSSLGVFVSKQFQDIDYLRLKNQYSNRLDSVAITNLNSFSHPLVAIDSMRFRITLGDTNCSILPISTLPNTMLYLCDIDSVNVQAFQSNSSLFSQRSFWEDNSSSSNRTFRPLATPQQIGVEIVDNRGCYILDTLSIAKVADNPLPKFEYEIGCVGDSILLKNKSIINSGSFTSEWFFGDNSTAQLNDSLVYHSYLVDGEYTVKLFLTSNYGCKSDSIVNLPIYTKPTAIIDYQMDCIFQQHVFDNSNSLNSNISASGYPVYTNDRFEWKLDQVSLNQPQSFPSLESLASQTLSQGSHTMLLIVKNGIGCVDSTDYSFTVYPTDSAAITIQNACLNSPIVIHNNSIVNNQNATFTWKFSDNTISHDFIPVKTFNTSGIKLATFIITSDDLCADSVLVYFNVFENPSSVFSSNSTACKNTLIDFFPTNVNNTYLYDWNFGDGNMSILANSQHPYSNSGTYSISLQVTDTNLCTSSSVKNITIFSNPIASFSHDEVCLGNSTHLVSNSTGTNLNHNWSTSYNNFSTLNQFEHLFATAGTHQIKLTVIDQNSCADSITQIITVKSLPIFTTNSIQTCGNSYTLDATSSGSTYLWTPGNTTTPTFLVNQSGNYQLQLTSGNGCSDNFPISVTLNSLVQPSLGIDQEICERKILFTGINNADYLWSDGSTLDHLEVLNSGTFWVEVTDQNGCIGNDTIQILNVNPRPVINLGADISLCNSQTPHVLNAGNQDAYLWQNGGNLQTFEVNNSGYYSVKVTNSFGCTNSDTVRIIVDSNPISSLNLDSISICSSYTVIAGNQPSFTYEWNDGIQGALRTISQTGNYIVTITDPINNCITMDSIYAKIGITPVFDLGEDRIVCSNSPVIFDFSNTNYTFEWISSSQAVVSNSSVFSPTSSDIFIAKAKSSDGCVSSDVVKVQFLPSPVIPGHAPVTYVCGQTPVELKGSFFGTNNWTSSMGHSFNTQTISVFEPAKYYLTSSVNNCILKDTFELVFSPLQIQAFYLVDTDTSKNLTMQFIDLSEPKPTSYLWKFGDGTTDTTANPKHMYYQANSYVTSLTVSNGYCNSTYSKEITQKSFFENTPSSPIYKLEFESIKLYPNPTQNGSSLEIKLNDKANLTVKLFTTLGQVLQTDNYENIDSLTLDYDLNELSSGLYYISVFTENIKGSLNKQFKLIKAN